MISTVSRLSDRLLTRLVPNAVAAAANRCNCDRTRCCVTMGARAVEGYRYYDCISGHKCTCYTTGRNC
ncbi:hypothetical protein SMC26_18375 [Actinomadura fulvescens]|uniref:Uncharacterized protein n=1 Tax=Actinomadura fulvescens TaxID=46160 RepID=A0ABN3QFI7_9ACTN